MSPEDKNNDDIKVKIEKWLDYQGYPLEMKVAKLFWNWRFTIRQGDNFIDPEEGKARDIDVLAYRTIDRETSKPYKLQFIIECKYSKEPFIVFTYPNRDTFNLQSFFDLCNPVGKEYINNYQLLHAPFDLPIIDQPHNSLGYSIKQAHIKLRDNQRNNVKEKDDAYDAIMKVSKACTYLLSANLMAAAKDSAALVGYISLPIIVLDGPLFECYLDEADKMNVKEISSSIVNWSYPRLGTFPILINTLSTMEKFLVAADSLDEKIRTFLH